MKRSEKRILTTHTGSLPRPADLLDLLLQKETGQSFDANALEDRVRSAVGDVVAQQANAGVDVVSDGELGKPGFFHYVGQRLNGMDGRFERPAGGGAGIFSDFPDYATFQASRLGPIQGGAAFPECTGPFELEGPQRARR